MVNVASVQPAFKGGVLYLALWSLNFQSFDRACATLQGV